MDAEPDYIHDVIVGVGINVNQTEFAEELQSMATSIRLEKGMSVDRAQIILDAETLKRGQLLKGFDDDSAVQQLYNKAWDRIKATDEKK